MDTPSSSLPVSLLRQYAFCPRIPWFMETLGLNPPRPPWVRQGIDHHQRERMLQRRRRLSRYGLTEARLVEEPQLRAPGIGLHGRPDALLETEHAVYPLEFKLGDSRPASGHLLQVAAYALLAESSLGKPSPAGFILYGKRGKTISVEMDTRMREKVLKASADLRQSLEKGLLPVSPASAAQCTQCEFLNYCNDRE